MTRETRTPRWRRAFLRVLARGGSVALAAAECGIDRSSAYQLRKRNAAFAASWDRAMERARERLGAGPLHHPSPSAPDGPPPPEGEDRKGQKPPLRANETIRASKAGRPCVARVGPGRWSNRSERLFLEELTASANVKAAARAAGVSTTAAYNRRKLWPAFAEAWAEALAEGYVRIETLLIHAATATLDPEPVEAREAPEMSVEQAMNLFKLHRSGQRGGRPQRYGWRRGEVDIEEVRAEVLRKVAALERARG